MSKTELIPVEEFDDNKWHCYPCNQEGKETDATVVLSQLYTPFTGLCAECAAQVDVTPDEQGTR